LAQRQILVVTILWLDETPLKVLNAWQFRALFFHFLLIMIVWRSG